MSYRYIAVVLVALISAPIASAAANFPGWTRNYQDGLLILVSPKDDNGVVQFVMSAAERETGDPQASFRKALDELVAGLGGDLKLAKRSGMRSEGGLMFEVLTTTMEGVPIDFLFFVYEAGAKIYQGGALVYVSAVPDTDPRVSHALDFIATAARKKFRLADVRAFDRAAPTAAKVTAYNERPKAPPQAAPIAPPQNKGKACERRPIWGFRVSYWCQPSGICNDRVIKGYETVCE